MMVKIVSKPKVSIAYIKRMAREGKKVSDLRRLESEYKKVAKL